MNVWAYVDLIEKLRQNGERNIPPSESRRMSRRTYGEVTLQQQLLDECPAASADVNTKACVYVLAQRSGAGFVKIGTTLDLHPRVGDHQANAFGELSVLAAFHGDRSLEQELHRKFTRERVWGHREHFYASAYLLRWVDDVCRLNGRDGNLCWSCRRTVVADQIANPYVPLHITKVDVRCGVKCIAQYAWFDLDTYKTLCIRDNIGRATSTPSDMAQWLFEAEDPRQPFAGVWGRLDVRAESDPFVKATVAEHYRRFDHRQTLFFPEGVWFPDERPRAHQVWRWAGALMRRFGVAAVCRCAEWEHGLRQQHEAMSRFPRLDLSAILKEK
jgi:hypothetical protein